MTRPVQLTVLGGGSWGTTVASLAASNTPTTLWVRDPELATEIDESHTNGRYLPEHSLCPSLRATADLQAAVAAADALVVAVPSHGIRATLEKASAEIRPWIPILSLAKGLEPETRLRPTEVLEQCAPGHPVGLLAGPNVAREVLDGYAAAAVVSTMDGSVASALQPLFRTRRFRVYRNSDVIGCELGGILKNIIAIASGMADGLGTGHNTRAMVLARGLNEMTLLGEAMGASARTFAGLTGLGDLMTTCSSPQSRNRRVGEALGKGQTIEEVMAEMNQVAEGVRAARTVVELAESFGVAMPIAAEVDAVVNEGRSARQAYSGLLRTEPEHEHDEVA